MASKRRSDLRKVETARQPAEFGINRSANAHVESPCEAEEFNFTFLRYELRNFLASIQLAIDTMTRCRPTCPASELVNSNLRFQIARLSNLLNELDRAQVASDRQSQLVGRCT